MKKPVRNKANLDKSIPNSKKNGNGQTAHPAIPPPPEVKSFQLNASQFSRWEWYYFTLLCVAAVITRFGGLADHGFWVDEIMTIQDSQRILNPTFYRRTHWMSFLMVRLSTELFGTSEFSVRLPSALAGVLCVPVIFLLARQCLGSQAAVSASLLTLLSPYLIHFSHEGRYYTQITFLAALLLMSAFQIIRRERIVWVVLLILSGIALYGIHVSTGIFVISVYLFTLAMMIHYQRYRLVWHHVRYSLKYRLVIAFLILLLLAGAVILWRLMGGNLMRALANILNIADLKRTPGIALTWGFFSATWRRFPAISGVTLTPWGWKLFFVLFLAGHYYCWRRQRMWVPILYWLCFASAHLALFLIPLNVPYTEKYLIFLYPLYIMCTAAGISLTVECLAHIKVFANLSPGKKTALAGALAMLISAVYWGDIYRIYTMEIDPTKKVMTYFKENAGANDVFLTSGFTPQYIYYAPSFQFNRENFIRYSPQSEADLSRRINKYIIQNRDIWFILWAPIGADFDRDKTRGMLEQLFTLVYSEPSYFSSSYSQEIFKLDRTHPLIGSKAVFTAFGTPAVFPFPDDMLDGQTYQAKRLDQASGNTVISYDFEFTALLERDYFCSVWLESPEGVDRVRLAINDQPVTFTRALDTPEFHWISDGIPLNYSHNTLRIECSDHSDSNLSNGVNGLMIITDGPPLNRTRDPNTYYRKSHYLEPTIKKIDDSSYLEIARTGYLEYYFSILSAGDYELIVEGLNDVPGPIIIQVDLNGQFHKFITFSKNDHSFSTNGVYLPQLKTGEVIVTLHFINSIYGQDDDNINRVFGVRQIRLEKLNGQSNSHRSELRLPLFNHELFDADTSISRNGSLTQLWSPIPNTDLSVADNDQVEITLEPYDQTSQGLISSAILYTNERGGVYVAGEVNIDYMLNHTFNVLALLMNEDDQVMLQHYLLPTGYMVTEGWQKFAAFLPLVQELEGQKVKAVIVGLVAYPNSTMPGETKETFSLRNVSLKPW